LFAKLTDDEASAVEGIYQDLLLPLDRPNRTGEYADTPPSS
jgi:hypothetical protein